MRRAIEFLYAQARYKEALDFNTGKYFKFKINFATLTLPTPQGEHSDETIKREALKRWIEKCKAKRKLKSYVWKAESQENGNIHFHVVLDTYIHMQDLRNDWNCCLNKLGYIDAYQEQMREFHRDGFNYRHDLANKHIPEGYVTVKHWPLCAQLRAYEYGKKTEWRDPNSTDIHALKSIQNVAAYLIKYMVKNEDNKRPIEGKLWGCSDNLLVKEKIVYEWNHPQATWLHRAFMDLDDKVFKSEFNSYLPLTKEEFNTYVKLEPRHRFEDLLIKIRESA
jgi:hypothetical protein